MCEVCKTKGTNSQVIHHKIFAFEQKEIKEIEREDGHFGIIKGYASTYGNVDRGGDVVLPGAFTQSIKRHKSNNRKIRMYFQHDRMSVIGGWPINLVRDDSKGLYVEGEINLGVQKGMETYLLAKQGVIQDLSIGYSILEEANNKYGGSDLKELELWEVSPVSEPMNDQANILEVKGATPFKDLPLADRNRPWSASDARDRVRAATNSADEPSATYRNAFFWYDSDNPNNFGSYKLPFVDVVDGKLTAIPRAIFNAAARLNQTQIPSADKTKVASHINRYYAKMELDSPLKSNGELKLEFKWLADLELQEDDIFDYKDIENYKCMKDIENFLKNPVPLSNACRKALISKIKSFSRDAEGEDSGRDVREMVTSKLREIEISKKLDDINKLLKR